LGIKERAEKVKERLFGERSWDEPLFFRWNRGERGARGSGEAEPGDGLDVFDKRAEEKNEIRERTVLYGRMGIGLLWDLLRQMVDLFGRGGLWVLEEVRWESNRGGQIWEKGMQVVCWRLWLRCLIKVLKESRVRKGLVKLSQGTARVSHAHTGCAAAKGRRTQDQGVSQSCSDTMKDLGEELVWLTYQNQIIVFYL